MIGKHKFASGVADSANAGLVLASDWNADVVLGYILTNRTGGTLNAGDVVALDGSNNDSVVLADTAGAQRPFFVFISATPSSSTHTPATSIANLETGLFAPAGTLVARVAGATTRGNYLRKSATARALEDTGVAQTSAPPAGSLAVAAQSAGGAGTILTAFSGLAPITPGGPVSVQVFTGNGTWTRPAGVRRVLVEVYGGGGGGGRRSSGNPSHWGGAGGGYAAKLINVTSIASSTITVGAGGAGATVDGNTGSNGGTSTWSDRTNTVSATGGAGGAPASDPGPNAGVGSGGDINLGGGNGMRATGAGTGGNGGSGAKGGGGGYGTGTGGNPGQAGGAYGGGGGAAVGGNGGDGGAGVVIAWEFA